MEPHIVDQATNPPGKCLVSRDETGPFIDTGCYAMHHNPYLYLSVRWVKEVAQNLLGMVPAEQVQERFGDLEAQIAEQAEQLALLEHFAEVAADYEEARQGVSPDLATVEADAEAMSAITGGAEMDPEIEAKNEAKVAAAPDVATATEGVWPEEVAA